MRCLILLLMLVCTAAIGDDRSPIIIQSPFQTPNLQPPGPAFPQTHEALSGTDEATANYGMLNDNAMDTTPFMDTGTDQGIKEQLPPLPFTQQKN